MKELMKELLLGFLVLLAAQLPVQGQVPPADAASLALRPGDLVQITVWQRPELSGEFAVMTDGSILHPLYRQVRVAGIPVEQVEQRLRSFLSGLEADPQFVVQPLFRVAILGQVGQPDVYNLPPGTTVVEAVTGAGGVTEEGEADDVRLLRGSTVLRIDLTAPGSQDASMLVHSGDQIVVERGGSSFFRDVFLPLFHAVGSIASIVNIAIRN